jgi:pimeloyl-ACP methyl ester carboxylesterase
LQGKVSLFVPELPGYGISTPSKQNRRIDIASALIEAMQKVFDITSGSPRKVIAGGHDRGGRVVHRIAVSRKEFPAVQFIGAVMLDIVPTKVQWDAFSNPASAVNYFHWPLLANVDTAVDMLLNYGGGKWCRAANLRMCGSEAGTKKLTDDQALDAYAECFEKEETLRYSCEDYAYGAAPECQAQQEDQENGRKIDIPTLVMFSAKFLGSRLDVAEIWKDWIASGVDYQGIAVGNDAGHFLPEEASQDVSQAISAFIKKHS